MEDATITVRVSGEPFDISTAELGPHPHCILGGLARSTQRTERGHKLLEFPRDVRAFRVLRLYLSSGELLVPLDPLDRQLLAAEALFYGLTGVQSLLMSDAELQYFGPPPAPRAPSGPEGPEQGVRAGWSAPSAEALKLLGAGGAAPHDEEAPFWIQGERGDAAPRAEVLTDAEALRREEEHAARVEFGADRDATPYVREWAVPLFAQQGAAVLSPRPSGRAPAPYTFLRWPGSAPEGPSWAEYVDSLSAFRENFQGYTLGLGEDLLAGLPLVAAGGAVLAALHVWEPVQVPAAGEILGWQGRPEEALAQNWRTLWPESQWRRRRDQADRVDALRAEIQKMKAGAQAELPQAELPQRERVRIGRVVRMAGGFDLREGERLVFALPSDAPAGEPPRAPPPGAAAFRSMARGDLDLFLVTRDPDVALQTVAALHRRLHDRFSGALMVYRSEAALTFVPPVPHKRVQVVLRLYHSPEQVILGFDLDCCAMYFDGTRVVALPRAVRALQERCNLVDTTRQSTTYEARLLKYARRGFEIAVPYGIDVARSVEAAQAAFDTEGAPAPRGFDLLVAALAAQRAARRGVLRRWNIHACDYGPLARSLPRPGRTSWRLSRRLRRNTPMPVAAGSDLAEVLGSALYRHSDGTCPARVPPRITFLAHAPHAQDRVDVLFSGSFHPIVAAWLPPPEVADRPAEEIPGDEEPAGGAA